MIPKDSISNLTEERRPARAALRRRFADGLPRTALGLLLPLLPAIPATAQETGGVDKTTEPALAASSAKTDEAVPYISGNRPDPFFHLSEKPRADTVKKTEDVEIVRGTPPPGIAGTFVDGAGLEGIVIRDDKRTAVVRGADNRAYFLHEGDRLFDGYLKTIKEDSVVLIRERRMQSGNILTQDVIKRLRKP